MAGKGAVAVPEVTGVRPNTRRRLLLGLWRRDNAMPLGLLTVLPSLSTITGVSEGATKGTTIPFV